MGNYDVVIVGAGAAGIILARELGNAKKQVLLLDKKENLLHFSFNTLGSFIDLDKFNLSEDVVAQKINEVIIASKNLKSGIDCNLYILDKAKLHEELLNSLDKNYVTLKNKTSIKRIIRNNKNFTEVIDKDRISYKGKIFVDASGTKGVLSKKHNLAPKQPALATGVEYNVKYKGNPEKAYLLIGKDYKGGYGWIFPLKDKRAIIGFGTFEDDVVKELKQRLNAILELKSIKKLVEKDNNKVEGGSIPITPVLDKFVLNNLVCVGDSVSQVNPIVGEGYKFIFESSLMASKSIIKSLNANSFDELKEYEKKWRYRFLENYKRSKKAQQTIFKMSGSNLAVNAGLLLSKLRSNSSNLKSLSGEYDLNKL